MPVYRDPDPRLRLLPLRPERAAVHEADRAQARARGGADRPRHPRRRQRRRRAAVDPRGHDRAARPPGAELRPRQLQRLQHLLSASRVEHVGRLVGLAGRRHRGPRRGAERRRELAGRVELLPAARPRARSRSRRSSAASPCRAARCRRSSSTSRSPSCAGSGSTRETEARVRAAYPQQTGLLVVEQVIPDSAAVEGSSSPATFSSRSTASSSPSSCRSRRMLDAAVGERDRRRRRARRRAARTHASWSTTCTRSRPTSTSSTATACSTSCRISRRGTSIGRWTASTSRTRATCSARRRSRAAAS